MSVRISHSEVEFNGRYIEALAATKDIVAASAGNTDGIAMGRRPQQHEDVFPQELCNLVYSLRPIGPPVKPGKPSCTDCLICALSFYCVGLPHVAP